MQYSILVFNRENLGIFSEETLLDSITESNFETLCKQYALNPSLIEPALRYLEVVRAKTDRLPYFMLIYGKGYGSAIVVQEWDASSVSGKKSLQEVIGGIALESLTSDLLATRWLVEIVLAQAQLQDMGLLLAYEVARWAADRGKGLVYGLDGVWYRLNQYKAFIPTKNHTF